MALAAAAAEETDFYDTEFGPEDTQGDDDDIATKKKGKCIGCMKDNLFMILILLGVACGFGLGFGVKSLTNSVQAQQWIGKSFHD